MPVFVRRYELYFLIASIFIYKLLTNVVHLQEIRTYRKMYIEFISQQNYNFAVYQAPIRKLFKYAGLNDVLFPICEPAGYGEIMSANASLFANMGVLREDIQAKMFNCFSSAEGVFRMRVVECFSPFYWIECVIFFPKNAIEYLGLNSDGFLSKLLQLIYWIAVPLLISLRSDVYNYIIKLLSNSK